MADDTTNETEEQGGRSWYFEGDSVVELAERLTLIGPANTRLWVRLHGNKVTLDPVGPGYSGPPINVSHPCPGSPGCP